MDITPEKVLEIQQYAREPISLDQTIGDEGDSQLGDFIEDSEAVVAVDAVSFTLMQDQLTSVLQDRKSTRLNSSHANISYAVFCLKNKNIRQYEYSNLSSFATIRAT